MAHYPVGMSEPPNQRPAHEAYPPHTYPPQNYPPQNYPPQGRMLCRLRSQLCDVFALELGKDRAQLGPEL